jgi:hypothetical protein
MSVALVIHNAKRMRHIVYSSVANCFINWTISGEKMFLVIKCIFRFSLQLLSEVFLILRGIQRDTAMNVHRFSCNVPVILRDFHVTWIFSTNFRKILKYQLSWKSVQWEPSCPMRTGEQIDVTKPTFAFRNFANAPTNGLLNCLMWLKITVVDRIFLYSVGWSRMAAYGR